jgi:photosystem II stability/assembly factor-like uncharacterized protein
MLIVSIAQQGLWSSENGANTWSKLGTGPGSATITNRGSLIVYDPDHPDTFWESGIYNGNGVYRTDDGGRTFQQLGTVAAADAVSVDLSDPQRRTLFTGTHERMMAFRSTDGGQTWTDVAPTLPADVGFTIGPHVIDAKTFLLGTNSGPGAGIFRTTDAGASWTSVFKGEMAGVPVVTKSDGTLLWVLRSGGIIKSTDQGLTWQPVARAGTINPDSWQVVELPDGRLAGVGRQVVIISADHGATWKSVGPTVPFPPTGFAYSPFRKQFYTWYFACERFGTNPIAPDQIMSLNFDYETQ